MRKILQGARKAAGMTQKQTAQAVGVSERTYQRIEAGTREGRARVWDKLETMFCLPQRQLRESSNDDSASIREVRRDGREDQDIFAGGRGVAGHA